MPPKRPARPALLPLSRIFGGIVRFRNLLYDRGLCKISTFEIPSICLGNISVGGTGKTPHTEYLSNLLQEKYKLAVLSRGYKRKTKGFVLAAKDSRVQDIGDEALQIAGKFPGITVAVHENRVKGMQLLLQAKPEIQVVLLDDAFQHRRLKAGLSIVLMDYGRPVYEDFLLPAGNLRETPQALSRADVIVCSKCPPDISAEKRKQIASQLSLKKEQSLFFSGIRYGKLRAGFPDKGAYSVQTSLAELKQRDFKLMCFCGIASPDSFVNQIRQFFPDAPALVFPDHHEYKALDLAKIQSTFEGLENGSKCIITTQKDHMHLIDNPLFEALTPYIYYIEIDIHFVDGQEEVFNNQINDYVRKHTKNPSLA
ncbi:MAG: tetraacyldisaccharide 4'-kinase [Bacteroidales bacterium]|nr:tetraacyldisaccharide 4'-kinase [Bacteroidales bacterium]